MNIASQREDWHCGRGACDAQQLGRVRDFPRSELAGGISGYEHVCTDQQRIHRLIVVPTKRGDMACHRAGWVALPHLHSAGSVARVEPVGVMRETPHVGARIRRCFRH